MTSVSVIIPTRARPTLGRAIESATKAGLRPGDEVLVVGAGDQPAARSAAATLGARYEELDGAAGEADRRNAAGLLARADLVLWLEEHDMLLGGAVELLRANADERGAPVVYRGEHRNGVRERAVLASRELLGDWRALAGYVQDTIARAGRAPHDLAHVAYYIKPYPGKW